MVKVKIDGETYTLASVDDALASLDGDESEMLETFLGGFDQLGKKLTRTTAVTVWLTLRSAGKPQTLEQIMAVPGLAFGGLVTDDGEGEPEDPMKDPGRPLVDGNEPNGSTGGGSGSVDTPAISDPTGGP